MKEIKNKDKIYLGEYDIFVEPYLNYGQIQNIINSIKPEMSWSERQQNIEMIVLYYVTDIGMEKLEEIGHETLLKSGLIDAVLSHVENLSSLYDGISYTQSTSRALSKIIKELPKMLENQLGKKVDGKNNK